MINTRLEPILYDKVEYYAWYTTLCTILLRFIELSIYFHFPHMDVFRRPRLAENGPQNVVMGFIISRY